MKERKTHSQTKMEESFNQDSLKKALVKKAMGYVLKEVVEEYVNTDDKLILNKRKVTSKAVPPDIPAAKVVLDMLKNSDYSSMSDEDLLKERERLLELLNNTKEVEDDTRES